MSGRENPSAFPYAETNERWPEYGMTLRDWFAGQALPATVQMAGSNPRLAGLSDTEIAAWAADVAMKAADAMLAARQQEQSA